MERPMLHGAGSPQEIADVKVVALYEPGTGNIVHMHTVMTFKGGRAVSEKEAIEAAQKQASRAGHAVTRLKTKVSSNHEHAARPHCIDPKSGKFVPLSLSELKKFQSTE
jgi:hypothetical protein